jgi:hypothetical protein
MLRCWALTQDTLPSELVYLCTGTAEPDLSPPALPLRVYTSLPTYDMSALLTLTE